MDNALSSKKCSSSTAGGSATSYGSNATDAVDGNSNNATVGGSLSSHEGSSSTTGGSATSYNSNATGTADYNSNITELAKIRRRINRFIIIGNYISLSKNESSLINL